MNLTPSNRKKVVFGSALNLSKTILQNNTVSKTIGYRPRQCPNGFELTSDSTIRFRDREELAEDLKDAGFRLSAVRDAPDRPGLEMVLLAQLETSRRS